MLGVVAGVTLCKKFNVGTFVTAGLQALEAEAFKTSKSYVIGICERINSVVAPWTDLAKNLGAVFHKPYGSSLFTPKTPSRTYTFINPDPVLAGGFGITINGKPISVDRLPFITDIEISQNVGVDTCNFTVKDPDMYFIEDNIYMRNTPIQASITIQGTEGDNNFNKIYFDGYISVVDIDFPSDGAPTLQVSCIDKASHEMGRKKWRRSWNDVNSAQVVQMIANEMGYKCYVEPDYPFPIQSTITQDDKTNLEFLEELAGNELDLFVVDPVVNIDGSVILYYIIKGQLNNEAYMSLGYKTVSWYEGMLEKDLMSYDIISFTPRINVETRQEEVQSAGLNSDTGDLEDSSISVPEAISGNEEGSSNSSSSTTNSSNSGGVGRTTYTYNPR